MRSVSRLLILLTLVVPSAAQRHGRPDSGTSRRLNTPPPELVLKLVPAHHTIYVKDTDFSKLKRCTVVTKDPQAERVRTYNGVYLSDLLSTAWQSGQSKTLRVSYGFFHTRTISPSQMGSESEPLIADMIDGKYTGGDKPFCLVIEDRKGHFLLIKKVTAIQLM